MPFPIQYQPQADHVLVADAVKNQPADGKQRIEPSARLVNSFTDEIRGELLFEFLNIFKRIMPLRHRHRAGIKPYVNQFLDAPHGALPALRAGKLHVVNIGSMQVHFGKVLPGKLTQLRNGADASLFVAMRAFPDRQRRAPIAVPSQRPIDVIFQPVAKTPVLDMLWHPVNLLVELHQALFNSAGANEPGRAGKVEQRRAAAPAEWVGMRIPGGFKQQPALVQVFRDSRVGILNEHASPRRNFFYKLSLIIDGHQYWQVVLFCHGHVISAKSRRDMDQPCAVSSGNVFRVHHIMGRLVAWEEGEQRRVALALQRMSLHSFENFDRRIAKDGANQVLCQNQALAAQAIRAGYHGVFYFRVRSHRHVAGQGPGGGRPDQQVGFRFVHQRKAHIDRGVFCIPVALGNFVVRKRGSATRAIRDNLKALVQQVFVPNGLQQPPDGFDILIPVGDIRPVQVHPVTDAFCQPLPILNAFEGGFPAKRVEFFDPVSLDLRFVVETELLLDLNFHRQPMRIPAAAAVNIKTVHGLVAREHILENARQDMMDSRFAIGGRRTLEKDIGRTVLALFGRFFEHFVHLPESQNTFFQDFDIQFW